MPSIKTAASCSGKRRLKQIPKGYHRCMKSTAANTSSSVHLDIHRKPHSPRDSPGKQAKPKPRATTSLPCPNSSRMRFLPLLSGLIGMLLAANLHLAAQDIDSIVTSASRTSATIADGMKDPAERSAFINIAKPTDPPKLLALTRSFLERYPRSAFLAQVAEGAARASFDLGDLQSGMNSARFSLSLLPENPLLLVAVADVQAVLQENEAAIASA